MNAKDDQRRLFLEVFVTEAHGLRRIGESTLVGKYPDVRLDLYHAVPFHVQQVLKPRRWSSDYVDWTFGSTGSYVNSNGVFVKSKVTSDEGTWKMDKHHGTWRLTDKTPDA